MSRPNLESVQEQDVLSLFGNLWELTKVETIAASSRNALVGGPFGSNLVSKDYTESGVPVIRGQNMSLGRWVSGEFAYVSEEKANQLSPNTARPGDLIFTQRGTLGQVAVVPEGQFEKYIISQSQMKLTPDTEKCDVMFLYYFFSSPAMQTYMLTNSIQVGVPHTNLSILKSAPVVVPPLPIQREIAHILGSLDDKIDLNRRMNATLESMARALFTSWFVNFDPVRAKAEGRQPDGIDADTAALFPDSFEDSALGPIPAGWRIGTLADVTMLVRDNMNPANYPDELFAHYSLPAYDEGQMPKIERGGGIKSNKYHVYSDCVLLSKLNPRIMKVWLPIDDPSHRSISSTEFLLLRQTEASTQEYLYSLVSSDHFALSFAGLVTGTSSSHQRVQPSVFLAMSTVIPPLKLVESYSEYVSPILRRIASNKLESSILAATRDALLPRLMSGEVEIH